MVKKFPKTLFVRVKDDAGEAWFQSDEDAMYLVGWDSFVRYGGCDDDRGCEELIRLTIDTIILNEGKPAEEWAREFLRKQLASLKGG